MGEMDPTAPPCSCAPADRLRIGDAERAEAAARLGDHYVAGRLTYDELDARLGAACAARVGADLAPLFVDLPTLAPVAPPVVRGQERPCVRSVLLAAGRSVAALLVLPALFCYVVSVPFQLMHRLLREDSPVDAHGDPVTWRDALLALAAVGIAVVVVVGLVIGHGSASAGT